MSELNRTYTLRVVQPINSSQTTSEDISWIVSFILLTIQSYIKLPNCELEAMFCPGDCGILAQMDYSQVGFSVGSVDSSLQTFSSLEMPKISIYTYNEHKCL